MDKYGIKDSSIYQYCGYPVNEKSKPVELSDDYRINGKPFRADISDNAEDNYDNC